MMSDVGWLPKSLNDYSGIIGTPKTMLACLAISGAVISPLCFLKGREFKNGGTFNFGPLDDLMMTVEGVKRNRMADQ